MQRPNSSKRQGGALEFALLYLLQSLVHGVLALKPFDMALLRLPDAVDSISRLVFDWNKQTSRERGGTCGPQGPTCRVVPAVKKVGAICSGQIQPDAPRVSGYEHHMDTVVFVELPQHFLPLSVVQVAVKTVVRYAGLSQKILHQVEGGAVDGKHDGLLGNTGVGPVPILKKKSRDREKKKR